MRGELSVPQEEDSRRHQQHMSLESVRLHRHLPEHGKAERGTSE